MSEPKTYTLDVPGAVLTYDVREPVTPSDRPTLLLIGSPMDASGFTTLAGLFEDRTVVTYDPRGVSRSRKTDGVVVSTPDQHADDLHRLIDALGVGPVDILASSGGAVNGLALVARHPEQVRVFVPHEPPVVQLLADRETALAAVRDTERAYQEKGAAAGLAKFMLLVSLTGDIPADFASLPASLPPGFPVAEDDGSRDDALLGQNLITCTHYEPDIEALRAASTRIVPAVGVESAETLAGRGGAAVAERLGVEPAVFPSHHAGFAGGEFGMAGEPEAFAARLREILDGDR
ncbi:alpha/beta hydrolase [Nonomuraea sp. NPDC050310]|uniref:alpha/beta fold hydrolase n=1 Tax=unclassified Nonomuraea TaxID=2593643 RepID=UPI0033F227E8